MLYIVPMIYNFTFVITRIHFVRSDILNPFKFYASHQTSTKQAILLDAQEVFNFVLKI